MLATAFLSQIHRFIAQGRYGGSQACVLASIWLYKETLECNDSKLMQVALVATCPLAALAPLISIRMQGKHSATFV